MCATSSRNWCDCTENMPRRTADRSLPRTPGATLGVLTNRVSGARMGRAASGVVARPIYRQRMTAFTVTSPGSIEMLSRLTPTIDSLNSLKSPENAYLNLGLSMVIPFWSSSM